MQIPNPQLDILFFIIRHIQWHFLGVLQGHAPPPLLHKRPYVSETVQMPNPKEYIFLFFMMTHPVILTGSPRAMPHPLHFIKCQISQKIFRAPPLAIYILVPQDKNHPNDTDWGYSGGIAHPSSFYKRPFMAETFQIPIYIVVPYEKTHPKDAPGYAPPPPVHKRPNISETVQVPIY